MVSIIPSKYTSPDISRLQKPQPPQTTKITPTKPAQVGIPAGGYAVPVHRGSAPTKIESTPIIVVGSDSIVQYGNVKYFGDMEVGKTGMTADQYLNLARQDILKQYPDVTSYQAKRGTVTYIQETIQPSIFSPISSKITLHETKLPSIPLFIPLTKEIFSPLGTSKSIITGFEDIRTHQSIPIANLSKSQKLELEKEGWIFEGEIVKTEVHQPITPQQYAKLPSGKPIVTIIPKQNIIQQIETFVGTEYNLLDKALSQKIIEQGMISEMPSYEKAQKLYPKGTKVLPGIPGIFQDVYVPLPSKFIYGATEQIVKDFVEHPIEQAALVGTGAGLGLAFKGGATILSAIPKIGPELSSLFKVGAISYGVYQVGKTGVETTIEAINAKNEEEAGKIVGGTVKDLALMGIGAYGGERVFDIARGRIITFGLKELKVEKGIYPSAPTVKQLELFAKNIYPEISKNPIAFHTTENIISLVKQRIITPSEGASELAGLYAATKISTPFTRIPGSGVETPKNFAAFKKSIIQMFVSEKVPGVAALEPKGFREVKIGYSNIKQFEGQKYIKGKGFAYYKTPARPGFMDIPGIKTEIEAIARIKAGEYKATGKRFYTEVSGVRIPIDAFKYTENIGKKIENIQKDLSKKITGKKFVPKEYTSYRPSTISEAFLVSRVLPSSTISKSISSELSSISSSVSKSLSSSAVSSRVSLGSSSISSQISSISSGISSSISNISSGISSQVSRPSSVVSRKVSAPSYVTSYKASSSILSPSYVKSILSPSITYPIKRKIEEPKQKTLGQGYNVYGKIIKTNRFEKINNYPLTKNRARDIGSYYVSNTLARTFRIEKTNSKAQPDYQFISIPEGYFQASIGRLREYKIRQRKAIETPEQFIQKGAYALSSIGEKKQIQAFRKQVEAATKGF